MYNCTFYAIVYCMYIYILYMYCIRILAHILHFIGLMLWLFVLLTAVFTVSLELQGGDCSDHLTLTCRHSDNGNDPLWIHNDTTVEGGDVLGTAFPDAMYTVQALTEHTATITGVDNVQALDGYLIQCVYNVLGNLTKSNTVKFSFIPSGQS